MNLQHKNIPQFNLWVKYFKIKPNRAQILKVQYAILESDLF